MLLKSSSTPVLGSLLSSHSDSPNNSNHTCYHDTNSIKNHPKTTIPFYHTGSINLSSSFSCISSPVSPSVASKGIRHAQSEGNLEGLAYGSCSNTEDFLDSSQLAPNKFTGRHTKGLMLQTIPSFSFYGTRGICEDKEEEFEFSEDDYDDEREKQEKISQEISNRQKMVLTKKSVMDRNWDAGIEEERGVVSRHQEMSLATGLGGDNSHGGGSGSGNGGHGPEFNSGGGDGRNKDSADEYYRRMMEENPGNPSFLKNYAQFLYQSKGDLQGAEKYYSRAIIADPRDGEIISQNAQLLWELHHDQDRALSYFERAVQASPEDSHVHAAYANFLWEMEEDEEGCNVPIARRPYSHGGAMKTASA